MTNRAPASERLWRGFLSTALSADYRRSLFPGQINIADLGAPPVLSDMELITDGNTIDAAGQVSTLDWDSQFFGQPAGRLDNLYFDSQAGSPFSTRQKLANTLVRKSDQQGIKFLSVRITAEDTLLVHALENTGFRLSDLLNIYTVKLEGEGREISGHPEDVMEILQPCIADMNFGRIHQDPNIEDDLANAFYTKTTEWVLSGKCHVSSIKENGKAIGFAIGVLDEDMSKALQTRYGFLWLIAVHPEYKGCGMGSRLLKTFMDEFSTSCDLLEIGTQAANIPANRIYQTSGCRLATQAFTFHRWT